MTIEIPTLSKAKALSQKVDNIKSALINSGSTEKKLSNYSIEEKFKYAYEAKQRTTKTKETTKQRVFYNLSTPESVIFNDSISPTLSISTEFSIQDTQLFAKKLASNLHGKTSLKEYNKKRMKEEPEAPTKTNPSTDPQELKPVIGKYTSRVAIERSPEKSTSHNNWYSTDRKKIIEEIHQRHSFAPEEKKTKLKNVSSPRHPGLQSKNQLQQAHRSSESRETIKENAKQNALLSKFVEMSKNITSSKGHSR